MDEVMDLPAPESNQPPVQDREAKFRQDLEHLLNSHSRENGSNTPDFTLAQFLADSLRAWDLAVTRRNEWYAPKRHTISGSDAADDDDMPSDLSDGLPHLNRNE